jgi:HEAT repeat protein
MKSWRIIIVAVILGALLAACSNKSSVTAEQIAALIQQLEKSSWETALKQIVEIGAPAEQQLIDVAQSKNQATDWQGARACYALAALKSRRGIDVLEQVTQDDMATIRRRRYAIQALGKFNISEKTNMLIQLLNHKELYVAHAAATSLGQIGTPDAINALLYILDERPHYATDQDICRALVKNHAEKVTQLNIVQLNTERYWGWMQALENLVKIGEPAVPTLIQHLDHKDDLIRWRIVRTLGRISSEKAANALISSLADKKWMIRNEAAVALVKTKSIKSLSALKVMLQQDSLNYAYDDISWVVEQLCKTNLQN